MQLNAPWRGWMFLSVSRGQDWKQLGIRMQTVSLSPWPRHGWHQPTLNPLVSRSEGTYVYIL